MNDADEGAKPALDDASGGDLSFGTCSAAARPRFLGFHDGFGQPLAFA